MIILKSLLSNPKELKAKIKSKNKFSFSQWHKYAKSIIFVYTIDFNFDSQNMNKLNLKKIK